MNQDIPEDDKDTITKTKKVHGKKTFYQDDKHGESLRRKRQSIPKRQLAQMREDEDENEIREYLG